MELQRALAAVVLAREEAKITKGALVRCMKAVDEAQTANTRAFDRLIQVSAEYERLKHDAKVADYQKQVADTVGKQLQTQTFDAGCWKSGAKPMLFSGQQLKLEERRFRSNTCKDAKDRTTISFPDIDGCEVLPVMVHFDETGQIEAITRAYCICQLGCTNVDANPPTAYDATMFQPSPMACQRAYLLTRKPT